MIAVVIVVVVAAVVVILRVGGHTTLVPNFSSQPEGDRARKKDGANFNNLKKSILTQLACKSDLDVVYMWKSHCGKQAWADHPGSPRIPLGESPPLAGSPWML